MPKESVISGPLLHWTKVFILMDSRVRLKRSSKIALATITEAYLTGHPEAIPQFENILKLNDSNLIKIAELIDKATELVPEGMRSWSTQN